MRCENHTGTWILLNDKKCHLGRNGLIVVGGILRLCVLAVHQGVSSHRAVSESRLQSDQFEILLLRAYESRLERRDLEYVLCARQEL